MKIHKKISFSIVLFVFLFLSFSFVQAQDDAEEAHREALNRVAQEGLTEGDASILEQFIADDYVVHSPFGDLNRDAVRGLFDAFRASMTDFQVGRENMVVEGDMAAMRTILTGTFDNEFTAPFGVFPPTGAPFRLEIINIFAFNEDGVIQEEWAQFDTAALMAQLSAMPAAEPTEAPEAMSGITQEFADTFAEGFDAVFNGAESVELADEIFAENFVGHLPLAPELDRDGWKAYVVSFYDAFSDMTQEVNQVIAADDRVILHVTYTGTHDGTLFGVPATGNSVSMNGIGIFSFNEDGLATENWAVIDVAGLLAQIGALPIPVPEVGMLVPAEEVSTGMMSQEEADHFIERLTAFFNEPNMDIADELFAPDTVNHLPLAPDLDLAAWKDYIASFYVGLSDIKQEVNQVIIAQDRLILDATYTGTHTGTLLGVPATGSAVAMNGTTIFRFNEEGLVVEAWCVIDIAGVLAQIGALPAPAAE